MSTIRVSSRPHMCQGREGYRIRWVERGGKIRSYFVLSRADAKYVKRRAKEGKLPGSQCWAVKA